MIAGFINLFRKVAGPLPGTTDRDYQIRCARTVAADVGLVQGASFTTSADYCRSCTVAEHATDAAVARVDQFRI